MKATTTDPRIWADEFMELLRQEGVTLDDALMTEWFGQAIERGRMAALHQEETGSGRRP